MRLRVSTAAVLLSLSSACAQGDNAPAPGATTSGGNAPVAVTLRTNPEPPTTGKNRFDVTLQAPNGSPVSDAEVTVSYFMIGMESMRSEVKLDRGGDGKYSGTGEVAMAGKWQVTVSAKREGREIGTQTTTIEAK
jgi:nitrogen fixation protein FixH